MASPKKGKEAVGDPGLNPYLRMMSAFLYGQDKCVLL